MLNYSCVWLLSFLKHLPFDLKPLGSDIQLQILLHFMIQIDELPDHIFILFSITVGFALPSFG